MKGPVLAALLVLSLTSCAGRPAAVAPEALPVVASPVAVASATEKLQAFQKARQIPGLSVAVGYRGQLIWAQAFGVEDLETRRAVTTESSFPIGSTTKTLTSIALGTLVERGKLDLDAPIQTYVPSFPVKPYPLSARLLAGHLAGIRDYDMATEYANARTFASIDEAVAVFRDSPLLFEPGTQYKYSAYNFVLLSAAIEGAAKQDFLDYVQQTILDPLGLVHTRPNRQPLPMPGLVRGHVAGYYGVPAPVQPINVSNKWAAGGYVSTPSEMVRFGNAILTGRLVRADTFALLSTPQKLKDGSDSGAGYAMGWRSSRRKLPLTQREARIVHHGGTAQGAMSFFVLLPELDLVVALQSNLLFEPFEPFYLQALEIADLFWEPSATR